MKILLALFVFTVAQSFSASVNAKPFDRAVQINTFDTVFFSFVSQTLNIDDIWINEENCQTREKIACTYTLAGDLSLVVSAEKDTGLVDGFNLIFAGNSDVAKFGSVSGSLMAFIDPKLGQAERSNAFIAMVGGQAEGSNGREFSGVEANYSITASETVGVWFSVTAK